jgi:hypothetical protein
MSLQPLPQLAPPAQRAPLPFKEPPKPLNLAPPPKPALDLAPTPKPALNLAPAPTVAAGAGATAGIGTSGAAALAGPAAVIAAAGLTLALLPDPSPAEQQANFDALPDSLKKDYCSLNPGDPVCSGAPALPDETDVTGGAIPEEVWAEGEPPFTGGQMAGVEYFVDIVFDGAEYNCSDDQISRDFSGTTRVRETGPIQQAPQTWTIPGCKGEFRETSGGVDGKIATRTTVYSTKYVKGSWSLQNIVRVDNQPDTGGDPAPVLTSTPASSPQRQAIGADPLSKLANPPAVDPIYLPTPIALPEPLDLQPKGAPVVDLPKAADPQPASLPNGEAADETSADTEPNPTPEPGITPNGYPTGKAAPKANAQNVPNDVPIPGVAIGNQVEDSESPEGFPSTANPFPTVFPPLIQPKTQAVSKLKDPTKPGETTEPIEPPPPPPSESPRSGCGCNPPIIAGQKQLGNQLDELKAFMANNGLDGAILEELLRMSNRMGTNAFPLNVPANLANPAGAARSVENLAESQLWQIEQLDGLVGQFPNTVTIEGPDGNTQDLDAPNISETLMEILGMLVGQTITTSEILHTSSRTLHQAGSATQQAHLAHLFGKANAEFLGYEGRPSATEMPMAYSPGKNPFEGFLSESRQPIQGWENVDSQDFKALMAELLQAAAIIRAVYWQKLDTKGDLQQQLQSQIQQQSDFLDEQATRKANTSDWDQFKADVESGFATRNGTDTPYGRDAQHAPKIRDYSADDTASH